MGPARKTADVGIGEFQTQVIMTIFHMIGNVRHSGMAALSTVELSYPQVLVLYALLEKGTISIGGLSQHLKISQGVISRTVDRMVIKGLVDRVRDSEDRRVVLVSLTEAGVNYATEIVSYHVDKLGDQFKKIPKEQRELFLSLLKQVDALLEEQDDGH